MDDPGFLAHSDQRDAEAEAAANRAGLYWSTLTKSGMPDDLVRLALIKYLGVTPQLLAAFSGVDIPLDVE